MSDDINGGMKAWQDATNERMRTWHPAPTAPVPNLQGKLAGSPAAPVPASVREAAQRLEQACEQLAATRTDAIYLAMIDGGQADALLELDYARRSVRTALASLPAPEVAASEPATMPERIQRKRSRGWKMPENTVYVGRPGLFGNPLGKPFERAMYQTWLRGGSDRANRVLDALPKLRGKNLACWCKVGDPCHADTLFDLANNSPALPLTSG